MRQRKAVTEAKKARAIELWNAGCTTAQIAERIGRTQNHVANMLKEAGFDPATEKRNLHHLNLSGRKF